MHDITTFLPSFDAVRSLRYSYHQFKTSSKLVKRHPLASLILPHATFSPSLILHILPIQFLSFWKKFNFKFLPKPSAAFFFHFLIILFTFLLHIFILLFHQVPKFPWHNLLQRLYMPPCFSHRENILSLLSGDSLLFWWITASKNTNANWQEILCEKWQVNYTNR